MERAIEVPAGLEQHAFPSIEFVSIRAEEATEGTSRPTGSAMGWEREGGGVDEPGSGADEEHGGRRAIRRGEELVELRGNEGC